MKTKLLAITICMLLLSAMVPQALVHADDTVYASYLGGTGQDIIYDVAVDSSGNSYVSGYTMSTDFPVTADAFQSTNAGAFDAFVAKFDSSGVLVYSTYFGGSGADFGYSIALDNAGNIYVGGYTMSTDFPVTADAWQTTNAGAMDTFVARFDATCNLTYCTYFGGTSTDFIAGSIAVDGSGNSHLCGFTGSTDIPTTGDAFQSTNAGGMDSFVASFDSSGALVYSTYIGGTDNDQGRAITLDSAGNRCIVGNTLSTDFPTTGDAFQSTNAGGTDGFVARFNSSGALVYSTYLGGTGDDSGYDIAADDSGNCYATGNTNSTNFPVTAGAFQSTSAGNFDAFVSTFNSSGALDYSTYIGGTDNDQAFSIDVNYEGNSSITVSTSSADFPTTGDAFQSTNTGGMDVFVSTLDSSGALAYSTYCGGADNEQGLGVIVNSTGSIYTTGTTSSTDFPVTANACQLTNAGEDDGFVFFKVVEGEEPPTGSSSLSATALIVIPMVGIELDRTSIDYGDVNPGESSAVETIVVTNTGTYDVDVTLEVQGADATAQDFYEQSLYVNSSLYDIAAVIASILVGGSQPVETQLQVPATWSVPGAQEATYIFWAEATS